VLWLGRLRMWGHDVQGVCWLFNGVITLADAADTESARTTNTNFRITLPVFCARQAPNHSGTQSHLLAWHSWSLALRGEPALAR
jgi:hypothetical protein